MDNAMLLTVKVFFCLICLCCIGDVVGLGNQQINSPVSCESLVCQHISSSEAAEIIENAYKKGKDKCNLLLITSDASRGGKRLTGIASILREIKCKEDKKCDRVTLATRRIQSKNARDVSRSEIAAVALGIRAGMKQIPPEIRTRILFLTDSTSVIDFYCVSESGGNNHISSTLMNDPHFKAMRRIVQDTKEHVFMAKVKSNKMESDGFFDHDAADIISSLVKNISNKDVDQIYAETEASNDNDQECNLGAGFRVIMTPKLRQKDLLYLSKSEEVKSVELNKPQVVLKRERGFRLVRCRQRMFKELGVDLN